MNETYYMFMGVSVYCRDGDSSPARDSIGLAHSRDGLHFSFDRYVIEPDPIVCDSAHTLGREFVQMNDPSAILTKIGGQEYIYVVYAAAYAVPYCGNIGIAAYRVGASGLELEYQNDDYLDYPASTCSGSGTRGLETPSLERARDGNQLWVETNEVATGVEKIAIDNVNELDPANLQPTGLVGVANVELYCVCGDDLMLADGTTLQQLYFPAGSRMWSALRPFSTSTGQGWDETQKGGQLLVNPDTHQTFLYFTGTTYQADGGDYDSQVIGGGVLSPDTQLGQDVYRLLCKSTNDPDLCD